MDAGVDGTRLDRDLVFRPFAWFVEVTKRINPRLFDVKARFIVVVGEVTAPRATAAMNTTASTAAPPGKARIVAILMARLDVES